MGPNRGLIFGAPSSNDRGTMALPSQKPKVFISTTTADLGSQRADIRQAIAPHWDPITMDEWRTQSYQEMGDMLREQLEQCQAVIHVVGISFGGEPPLDPGRASRRSYTQLEFDMALELQRQNKLALYVIMCSDDFPYDKSRQRDTSDQRLLQRQFRTSFEGSGFVFRAVRTPRDLAVAALSIEPGEMWGGWDLVEGTWTHQGIAGLAYSLQFTRTGLNTYDFIERFFWVPQGFGRAAVRNGALEFHGYNWLAGRYGGKLWPRRDDAIQHEYLEGHVHWELRLSDFYLGRELRLRRSTARPR
jgi:hypothetical protein